ncbi:MAG: hypothetical protein IPM64_17120 [Phycisphaerales bacterium]|nr:hypothetical protein [Phycisphaerales bacterium]
MDRINVLVEEYRALYGLLSFRLAAVDQRVPLVAGALMAVVSSVASLPAESQPAVLLAIPVANSWLLRMTVVHARAKEDVLRRIDEIERHVNQLAAEELLTFQSRHPNRQAAVSGRTGMGAVSSVLAMCFAGLLACLAFVVNRPATPSAFLLAYLGYTAVGMLDLVHVVLRLRGYRYAKGPPAAAPVSRILKAGV